MRNKWSKKYTQEYHKEYYQRNKKGLNEYRLKWAKLNPERQREYQRKWDSKNPKKLKEYHLRWENKNPDYYKEYARKYRIENHEKFLENACRFREKKQKEPKFRLNKNMASSISKVLKGRKAGRSWEQLVDYSLFDLMNHLEQCFRYWMNWDNYGRGKGKWEIDHIKPISLFKFKTAEDEEFKKCWALENLRPWSSIKNRIKHNKY